MSEEPDTQLVVIEQGTRPHPVSVYLASLAPGRSRQTMTAALRTLTRLMLPTLPDATAYDVRWQDLRYEHAAALRALLADRYAHTTANWLLSALRGVLRACWRLGIMSVEDYQLAASVEPMRGSRILAGRAISQGELGALLDVCAADPTPAGRRDAALLALLYGCGLRRAEAARLRLGDYDREQQALRVSGKGNKQRLVYLAGQGAADALDDWLAARAWHTEFVGGSEAAADEPLFTRIGQDHEPVYGAALTPEGINWILKQRAQQARVSDISPHDLRRTFAGDLLDAGVDIALVQRMMGHAKVETTSRYDRRPEAAKRNAAAQLHVPYRRR